MELLWGLMRVRFKQKSGRISEPPTDRKSSIWTFPGKFVFYQTMRDTWTSHQSLTWIKFRIVKQPGAGFQTELLKGFIPLQEHIDLRSGASCNNTRLPFIFTSCLLLMFKTSADGQRGAERDKHQLLSTVQTSSCSFLSWSQRWGGDGEETGGRTDQTGTASLKMVDWASFRSRVRNEHKRKVNVWSKIF